MHATVSEVSKHGINKEVRQKTNEHSMIPRKSSNAPSLAFRAQTFCLSHFFAYIYGTFGFGHFCIGVNEVFTRLQPGVQLFKLNSQVSLPGSTSARYLAYKSRAGAHRRRFKSWVFACLKIFLNIVMYHR